MVKESEFISKLNEYRTKEKILVPKYKKLFKKYEEIVSWKKVNSLMKNNNQQNEKY